MEEQRKSELIPSLLQNHPHRPAAQQGSQQVLGDEKSTRHPVFELSQAMVNVPPRLKVIVARHPAEILKLRPEIENLLTRTGNSDDITRTPTYFLSTIRKYKEKPFVVAVYCDSKLAGIAYCLKRCLFGIPLGIVECGDWDGHRSMLSSEHCFNEVLDTVVGTIFRDRFNWLAQVGWLSATPSVVERALAQERSGKMITRALSFDVWNDLALGTNYEEFLASLGSQTRRNMRYYRRRAESAGWLYVTDIDLEEAKAAVDLLFPRQEIGKPLAELKVYLQHLAEVPGAFFSGLRNQNGEWISIIGGWVKGANVFIRLQLNDASYAKESVSVVLRGYVIEKAIETGARRMRFLAGCEGVLKKYCRFRVSHLVVQKRSYLSRLRGRIFCRLYRSSKIGCLFNDSENGSPIE